MVVGTVETVVYKPSLFSIRGMLHKDWQPGKTGILKTKMPSLCAMARRFSHPMTLLLKVTKICNCSLTIIE